jgi:hypothetical protein
MIVEEESYLAHYGVKGMRWGVRKDETNLCLRRSKEKGWPI